jgi:hypothetical protein
VSISPHWNAESSSQPKVRKLEIIILINQEILGLQVAMKDSVGMAVQQALVELMAEFLSQMAKSQLEHLHESQGQK